MEEWRDIEGYEGLYQVSDLGRVRNLFRTILWRGRIRRLRPSIRKFSADKGGYLRVILSRDGVTKSFKVHRLVASAFHPNPDDLPEVDHKDRVTSNNEATNLRWSTREDNLSRREWS